MLKDCRECDHPVATHAKTCPNCGVKKPTATKLEAGLDTAAAGAFQLAMMLCLLAVIIVACVSLAGCSSEPELWEQRGFESEADCWLAHGWDGTVADGTERYDLWEFWCGEDN